ncbi:MAG: ABC transporter permease [Deltaproteobacteria bacterium]|nr:ABC transporter permease [Deltaproteobacteria bacterium]
MSMYRLILRRLAYLGLVIFGMSLITFTVSHIVPADPIRIIAGQRATKETIEIYRRQYGMDKPLPVQYMIYVKNLVRGDLGVSIISRRPVIEDLKDYFPATVELVGFAMFVTLVIGIPLGVRSAGKRGLLTDHCFRVFAVLGVSMPIFWLGLVNQFVFYGRLEILPIGGRLDVYTLPPKAFTGLYLIDSLIAGDMEVFWDALRHLVLPGATMAFGTLAVVTRMTRTSMLECLSQEYVRTAQAKGLNRFRVTYIHALKNAAIPILTVVGLQTGFLLAGDFLAETIFNWPGIGRYGVTAINNMDFPAIMGVTLLVSMVYVLVNLVVDLLYTLFDPRIKY